ncbi:unnamed protein product [Sphenostylis stenocarpa]|uniref:Lipase n=1 Tax=Sphenostylis stenocarpa TaxID=92480 RepID=A0AA86SKM2_9FABA|nr:unnamed protein product [Sphenostylis stenocarpa]
MANTVMSLFSVVFLCITAAQGRKVFQAIPSSVINHDFHVDGICQTAVGTRGYPCEEHTVETDDGYILSLQRLPAGRSGLKANKPPVLLQHGLFCDALTWLVNPPEESLGFVLADSGYDVWVANTRGTISSRGHRSLSPNDADYWNWSWDELASYDLPAFVKYVHNNTGQKLHYVGHSLGTLMAFAAFSRGQVYDMLRSAALLSPIAHLRLLSSPVARVFADTLSAENLNLIGVHEFIPNGEAATRLVQGLCNTLKIDCSKILTFITGTIAKYDYGNLIQNMQHYGKPFPPRYDLTTIPNEFPLFLSYGGLDSLSEVKGVQILLNDLKNHDPNKLVVLFNPEYAHVDFFIATNVRQVIYDPIIAFFQVN